MGMGLPALRRCFNILTRAFSSRARRWPDQLMLSSYNIYLIASKMFRYLSRSRRSFVQFPLAIRSIGAEILHNALLRLDASLTSATLDQYSVVRFRARKLSDNHVSIMQATASLNLPPIIQPTNACTGGHKKHMGAAHNNNINWAALALQRWTSLQLQFVIRRRELQAGRQHTPAGGSGALLCSRAFTRAVGRPHHCSRRQRRRHGYCSPGALQQRHARCTVLYCGRCR